MPHIFSIPERVLQLAETWKSLREQENEILLNQIRVFTKRATEPMEVHASGLLCAKKASDAARSG